MFLHGDMSVEVVESAISLCAIWPRALVQPFDFVVTSTGTFLDGVTGESDE